MTTTFFAQMLTYHVPNIWTSFFQSHSVLTKTPHAYQPFLKMSTPQIEDILSTKTGKSISQLDQCTARIMVDLDPEKKCWTRNVLYYLQILVSLNFK